VDWGRAIQGPTDRSRFRSGDPANSSVRAFRAIFTTKKEVGTGLGLWLCKGIVERHHGSIRVKSSTAQGNSWTAFSVFLPASGQPSAAEALREAV